MSLPQPVYTCFVVLLLDEQNRVRGLTHLERGAVHNAAYHVDLLIREHGSCYSRLVILPAMQGTRFGWIEHWVKRVAEAGAWCRPDQVQAVADALYYRWSEAEAVACIEAKAVAGGCTRLAA